MGERGGRYLTKERRRFSAATMRSVEVGIQRRTEGHRDLVDDFVTAVVVVAAADELSSSAIVDDNKFDNLRGRYLTKERRRSSAAMMRSVEVGIQRRTEGHKDLIDDFVTAVVVVAAADELSSSAIVDDNKFDRQPPAKGRTKVHALSDRESM
ncbi:hypothetical protein U1Q18_005910 [Sarracenia purpurea var. burkii]